MYAGWLQTLSWPHTTKQYTAYLCHANSSAPLLLLMITQAWSLGATCRPSTEADFVKEDV